MMVALGALVWRWQTQKPELLAERYAATLQEIPDAALEPQLRQIAALGEAGLPTLVSQLSSERVAVRDAAHVVLLDEVNHWELLPAESAGPRLARLAAALADVVPRLAIPQRKFAADLALRIMDWPQGATPDLNRATLLAHCEAVLAATGRDATGEKTSRPVATASPDGGAQADDMMLASQPSDPLSGLATLPGGNLPLEPSAMPEPGCFREPQMATGARTPAAVEPARLPSAVAVHQLPRDLLAGSPSANQPRRLPPQHVGDDDSPKPLTAEANPRLDSPSPDDSAAWHQLQPREVMRRLHVSDPKVVTAARIELEHRGVTGSLIELARQATDPDPHVRRALAETLPSLPGIDAKPWLLELSYDEDPDVRVAAVTLMATSGDLELLKRVEQISRDDADDHTRAQAAKALPPRPLGRE